MILRFAAAIAAALLPAAAIAQAEPDHPPAPASASYRPSVPEPLVFDLMRPLGAQRGELEANVLAVPPLSRGGGAYEWAPEVEWAVADGFAVELELPFEDGRLAEWKAGAQLTLGRSAGGRTIHGVQYFGAVDRRDNRLGNTLVYIVGHRFGPRWSSLTMAGVGGVHLGKGGEGGAIVNQSVFHDVDDRSVAGLELNWKGGAHGGLLVMPQWHLKLDRHMNLQLGVGLDKERAEPGRPRGAVRLIREF